MSFTNGLDTPTGILLIIYLTSWNGGVTCFVLFVLSEKANLPVIKQGVPQTQSTVDQQNPQSD